MDLIFGKKIIKLKKKKFVFFIRFASHWKYQNRSYRTLTKAFGLRFIISVSTTVIEKGNN
jgi:hypothetical protein